MRFPAIIALCFATLTIAAQQIQYEVHATREDSADWNRRGEVAKNHKLTVQFALRQRNLEHGEGYLLDVSDPKSPNYGKHWSPADVMKTFAPRKETIAAVSEWLISSGIKKSRHKYSAGLSWLSVNSTVGEMEKLLKTTYYHYEHASSVIRIACDEYSLPVELRSEIDLITPTIDTLLLKRPSSVRKQPRQNPTDKPLASTTVAAGSAVASLPLESPTPIRRPKVIVQGSAQGSAYGCINEITPDCIRLLYQILPVFKANPSNSLAITEFATPCRANPNVTCQQWYSPSDLTSFVDLLVARVQNPLPILKTINDGYYEDPDNTGTFHETEESNLDFQLAIPLVWPQTVTLFQVNTDSYFSSILYALDASYCTYNGSDPYSGPGPDDYYGTCGEYSPPNVISTSYSTSGAPSQAYAFRECAEYLKLGLMGTSVLFSSGDAGTCKGYPTTCPYVTSVGSTVLKQGSNSSSNGLDLEESATADFGSGGYFSGIFGIPSWQTNAVGSWNQQYAANYPKIYTNASARGVPDVAALGDNIVVKDNGNFTLLGGTSASCPIFASILTLINNYRLNAGKSPVGFVNPALYQNPSMLTDITSGSNPSSCSSTGFSTTPGWDPVTGLGTPIFPAMLEYFMSLQ